VGKVAISASNIAATLESFIRSTAQILDEDHEFSRTAQLFDDGYIDSLGVVSLMAFIETSFSVELAEEDLFDVRFTTIDGISKIIAGRLPAEYDRSASPTSSPPETTQRGD
jgi:acyl carrier protein